jgi:hypothetical protein
MALVAVSIVAIISMAALSIDLGSLFEAKAEAQRSADLAALAAARVLSVTGTTSDYTNGASDGSWNAICGGTTSPASQAATSVAQQNTIGGNAPSTITISYGTKAGVVKGTTNCTAAGTAFGVNPVVQVYVQQRSLPIFFSRVFSLVTNGTIANSGVSATATAEVYNSSDSPAYAGEMIPVQPRCVKPWIVPNYDHWNSAINGGDYINKGTGALSSPGIFDAATGTGGVVGEPVEIGSVCKSGAPDCSPVGHMANNPPGYFPNPLPPPAGSVLEYIFANVQGTPTAVPTCATNLHQQAIAGCDESTVYSCGTKSSDTGATTADLSFNPGGAAGDTSVGAQCLINSTVGGSDSISASTSVTTPPFPFEITAGSGNPLVKAGVVNAGDPISASNSIVTLPIADYNGAKLAGLNPAVSIVGFMQIFITRIYTFGSFEGIVLNVTGCGNNAAGNPTVSGTSPVPIRLITSP